MILSTSLKRMAFVILALTAFFFAASDSSAQNLNRKVIFEEFTGTWCYTCPPGAWYTDTTEHHYPENFIPICWHVWEGYNEPMHFGLAGDTVGATWGITSTPTGFLSRGYKGLFGKIAEGVGFWEGQNLTLPEMQKAAEVDFRLVNVTYNAGAKEVEFDVDITPLNIKTMMKEDTTEYATVAVLTEDGLVYSQTYGSVQVPDFVHNNVARAVGGKVLGDKIIMGTKVANQSYPVRKHYKMILDGSWNPDKIKAKAFVVAKHNIKNASGQYHNILEGGQTVYVTTFGPESPDAVWVVLPRASYAANAGDTTGIVWSKAGTTTSAKLELTVDNGATWKTISASTMQSPFNYVFTPAEYDKKAKIRVSDVANSSVKSVSDEFNTPATPPPPATITVLKPAAGDTVLTGTSNQEIAFNATASVTQKKTYYYSPNGGTTWSVIGTLTSDATSYFGWNVPSTPTNNGRIKIVDNNNVTGLSGIFVVKDAVVPTPGKFLSLTLDGAVNNKIASSTATSFSWTIENSVGATKTIEISSDNGTTWTQAATATGDVSIANYTTPATHIPAAIFRIYSALDKSDMYTMTTPIEIGTSTSVKNLGGAPTAFTMSTNYPNPVASSTNINFEVPDRSFVTLTVRNELGVEVARLVNENLEAGKYSVDFSAANISNGLYTYILESGSTKLVGKMSVVK